DRMRDEDVAAHGAPDAFRDHRLAVAGRTVKEDRLPRVHRGPELIEQPGADDEMLEAGRQARAVEVPARVAGGADVRAVLREGHRRRTDVLIRFEVLPGA